MLTASFTKRVNNFWDWFSANEEKLSEFAQNRKPDPEFSERVIEFINRGTVLLGENIHFNIGGDNEFTFAVSGNHPLFFLLPYVTANLPERFRDKWRFFPCMQGTGGQNFGFRMYDVMTDSDNVMVSAERNKEDKKASLRFYAKEWNTLAEEDCYNAFFTLMEICIGEALAASCIDEVKKANKPGIFSPHKNMFPLTQLEKWLLDNLCENGSPPDPSQSYSVYRFEPQESPEPRLDVFTGSTNCMHLVNSYYGGEESYYNRLSSFGAKPIFLSFYYSDESDRNEVFALRNAIMDRLEEALGECGSGEEIGIMLGGAMGIYRAYIDILLFDEQAFIDRAKPLLETYPLMFFRKDFLRGGQEQLLFDYTTPGFDMRLNQLHDAGFHSVIINLLEAMTEEEKSCILSSIYARALINTDRETEAVSVLESIREQSCNDPLWHFRYGVALYHTKKPNTVFKRDQRTKES